MALMLNICIDVYVKPESNGVILLSRYNNNTETCHNQTISLYNTGGESDRSHYQLLIDGETFLNTEKGCIGDSRTKELKGGANNVLRGGGVADDITSMQTDYNESRAVSLLKNLKKTFDVKNRGTASEADASEVITDAGPPTIAAIKTHLSDILEDYKHSEALSNAYQKMKRIYKDTIGIKREPIINNGPPCDEQDKEANELDGDDGDEGANEEDEGDRNPVKNALDGEIHRTKNVINDINEDFDRKIQDANNFVADHKTLIKSLETFYKNNIPTLKISDDKTTDSVEDKDLGLIKFESERNLDASIEFFIKYRDELISTYKKIFTLEKPNTKPPVFGTEATYKESLQKIYDDYSKKYSSDDFKELKTFFENNKPSDLPFDDSPNDAKIGSIVKGVEATLKDMDTLIGDKITTFKDGFKAQLQNINVSGDVFSNAATPVSAAANAAPERKATAAKEKAAYEEEKDKLYNQNVNEIKKKMESPIKEFTAFKNMYIANIAEVIDCEIELKNFATFIEEKTGEKEMDMTREVFDKITISVEPGSYVVEQSQHQNSYNSILTPRDKMGIELRTEEMITKGATDEAAKETKAEIEDQLKEDPEFRASLEADAKKDLTKEIMDRIGSKIDTSAEALIKEAATA